MRVLITGGAGFFGSRAALYFGDADVHLVDRVGARWSRVDRLGVKGKRHEANLLDRDSTIKMLGRVRPDVIVHLAWYAAPTTYLMSDENFAHAHAAATLFLLARDLGCKRFVGAGTCFEYDTSLGLLREDSPTRPESVYAASKLATFLMIDRAARQAGVSFAWLRFFYPYGPFEAPGRLLSSALASLLAGRFAKTTRGEQLRDFIHVDDVARAIGLVATSSAEGIVNVGSGTVVSVRDAVSELARCIGRPDLLEIGAMPYREGDPMNVQADIGKLRSLGFEPRFSLKEGLDDTIAWARAELERA
jgi:nucleoside-diphosphate-sugar epimerase